jgi:hypothetical protein
VSETNLNQSPQLHGKHNNAVYYNHLLHFKQSGSNDQFPFLQGLMSNDLFPIWVKTSDELNFSAKEQDNSVEKEVAQDLLINDLIDTIDVQHEADKADFMDIETTSDKAVSTETMESTHLIDENKTEVDMAINSENHHEINVEIESNDENTIVHSSQPETTETDMVVPLDEREAETIVDEVNINELNSSQIESIENQEDRRFTLSELMQGVEEVSEEPTKKRKLKQSQKKILKKNILFFKELPELNSFNKWLIQQKPMEEGNLVKLLKLSKKAKKLEKKKQLNDGIEASIQKNDKLVSEVLAKILASQGHYVEAIEMYKQLILNIPEKSNTFAAEIDELNKKII